MCTPAAGSITRSASGLSICRKASAKGPVQLTTVFALIVHVFPARRSVMTAPFSLPSLPLVRELTLT